MRLTLRGKLTAFTLAIVLLVGGSVSLYSIHQGRKRILMTFEGKAREIASFLARGVLREVYFLDVRSLRLRLEHAQANPDIQYVYVMDADRIVLSDGTQQNARAGQRLTDSFSREVLQAGEWISREEDGLLKVGGPLLMPDGARIGYLQVGFSLEGVEQVIRDSTRWSILLTVLFLGIGGGLAFLVATRVSRPILVMTRAAEAIGAGKLDTRVAIRGTDEVGRLARAINEMASRLASSFAAEQAIVIENARLYAAADRVARKARSLYEVSHSLTMSLDVAEVLRLIAVKTTELLGTPHAKVVLWDDATQTLRLGAAHGTEIDQVKAQEFRLGEGVNGIVAQTRSPLLVNDYDRFPHRVPGFTEVVASIGVPLLYRERFLGVLNSHATQPGMIFTQEDLALLTSFADHAAIAIENARLYERSLLERQRLSALLEATHSLMSGLDLSVILDRIVEESARIASVEHVKVTLADPSKGILRVAVARGAGLSVGTEIRIGEGLSGTVAATGRPLFVPDSDRDPRNPFREVDRRSDIRSYLGLPIAFGGRILGVLSFNSRESRDYSAEETAYLQTFADQAAIAIENARLHEAVRRHALDLEARVQERTAELERALQAKSEFLARMSHELRTPLNYILGFAELMRDGAAGPLTAKQAQFIDRIHLGGKHLLDLVSDILDLTFTGGGRPGLRLDTLPLAPLVQEALDLVGVQAVQKRLTLTHAVEPNLSVVADRRKLFQFLTILLRNGVKFTPDGGAVHVAAQRVKTSRSGSVERPRPIDRATDRPIDGSAPWVEIVVRDTGIGIPPEDLERIFRGFEQAGEPATRRHPGVGIGLPLVRALVELHGGRVWAESAGAAQGSCFVVQLPPLEPPPPRRILVVEPEPDFLRSLVIFLTDGGYRVEAAASGAGAADLLSELSPDLLILDPALPDMDGLEILRRVRAMPATSHLPVLVLSGLGEGAAAEAKALGADEFFAKPVSPGVVAGIVEELLGRTAGR